MPKGIPLIEQGINRLNIQFNASRLIHKPLRPLLNIEDALQRLSI